MANGGSDSDARPSSRRSGHTARSRAAAPTNIVLERLGIVTSHPSPPYISAGVTHVRLSDNVTQGQCRVGTTQIDRRRSLVRGSAGATSTTASCPEHDGNGGDCHIKGALLCRAARWTPAITVPGHTLGHKPTKLPSNLSKVRPLPHVQPTDDNESNKPAAKKPTAKPATKKNRLPTNKPLAKPGATQPWKAP